MKILGDQIRGNPERILNNLEKVIVQLKTERYALPNVGPFLLISLFIYGILVWSIITLQNKSHFSATIVLQQLRRQSVSGERPVSF